MFISSSVPNEASRNIVILHILIGIEISKNSSSTGKLSMDSRICLLKISKCALILDKLTAGLINRRCTFHFSAENFSLFSEFCFLVGTHSPSRVKTPSTFNVSRVIL